MTSFIKPRISKIAQQVKELYPGNLVKTVRDEYILIVCGTGVRGMALAFNLVGESTLDEFAPIKTPLLLYRPQVKDLDMNMDFYCDIRYGIIPIDLDNVKEVLINDRTSEDMLRLQTYIECFTCLIKGEFGTNDKGQFEFYPNVFHRGIANILNAYNPNAKPNWYAIEFIQEPKEEIQASEENKNDTNEPETPEDPEEGEVEETEKEETVDWDGLDLPDGECKDAGEVNTKEERTPVENTEVRDPKEYLEEHDFYSKSTNEKVDLLFEAFEPYLENGKLPITSAYKYMKFGSLGWLTKKINTTRKIILASKEEFKFILNSSSNAIYKRFDCSLGTANHIRRRVAEMVNEKLTSRTNIHRNEYFTEANKLYESGITTSTRIRQILEERYPDADIDLDYIARAVLSNIAKRKRGLHTPKTTMSVDEFIVNYSTSVAISRYRYKEQVISQLTYMKNRFPNIIDEAESFTTNNPITDMLILYGIYRFTNKLSPMSMIDNPNFAHVFEQIASMSFSEFYKDFIIRDKYDEHKLSVTALPIVKMLCYYKFMDSKKKRALAAKISNKDKTPEEIYRSLDRIDKDFFIAIIGKPLSPAQLNVFCNNIGVTAEDVLRIKKVTSDTRNKFDHLKDLMTLI